MTARRRDHGGPLRVTTPTTKIGVVLGGYILLILVGAVVGLTLNSLAGSVVAAVIELGLVAFCSRVFRGTGEVVGAPRAWWRMTAGPRAGWVLAALFAASAASAWGTLAASGSDAVTATAQTLLAVAFGHSAARLSAR